MPIIRKLSHNNADILLWQLSETSDELLSMMTLTDAESEYFQKLRGEKRQAEWLCWHLMVRNYFGHREVEIGYDSSGRPTLNPELNRQISVTHGGNLVGIIISDKDCGIDIEAVNRNFSRVESRYMNKIEYDVLESFSDIAPAAAIGWCAKECAFKVAKRDNINFITDFIISDATRHNFSLDIESPFESTIRININIFDNHLICYSTR